MIYLTVSGWFKLTILKRSFWYFSPIQKSDGSDRKGMNRCCWYRFSGDFFMRAVRIQAQGPALWPSWGNRWYQASNLGQAIFRHMKLIGSSILMHFWVDSLKKSVVGLPNPWLTLQLRPKRCAARYKFWGSIIYLGKLQRPPLRPHWEWWLVREIIPKWP